MARPWWEENGFTTEWYWHQHRMRQGDLDDAQLARIIAKHGDPARSELLMLARSGNFDCYAEALERIDRPAPVRQADLFAALGDAP